MILQLTPLAVPPAPLAPAPVAVLAAAVPTAVLAPPVVAALVAVVEVELLMTMTEEVEMPALLLLLLPMVIGPPVLVRAA